MGSFQGDYRTLFFGDGDSISLGLREYQADDDVRHIDWNATARMDTPYVREHIDDRELTAWMLLDRSPSMSLRARKSGPRAALVLTELVATLTRLLTRRGNRVGAMLYADRVENPNPPERWPKPGASSSPRSCCGRPPGATGKRGRR